MVDSARQLPAVTAGMAKRQVDIWSTDATQARERFSYWRDAVCQAVFNISIEAPPERFAARITSRSAGTLRFATSESSGYRIVRSRRDIDSGPADHYSVFVQERGQSVIDQCGDSFVYKANDICISDGRYPFRADLPGMGRRAFAVIPRAMLDRRVPWLRHQPLRKLPSNLPFVDLARRHLLLLTADDSALNENAMTLMTENFCNLLALASAQDTERHRLQPELQAEALLAYCRQNLHDPELSPQRAADHLGISVRTLHLRFQQTGRSFGRFVLDSRLEACRTALRDPRQRASNISEIAYRCGFNDLSYFNKVFRDRFGLTPRDWRNGQC